MYFHNKFAYLFFTEVKKFQFLKFVITINYTTENCYACLNNKK